MEWVVKFVTGQGPRDVALIQLCYERPQRTACPAPVQQPHGGAVAAHRSVNGPWGGVGNGQQVHFARGAANGPPQCVLEQTAAVHSARATHAPLGHIGTVQPPPQPSTGPRTGTAGTTNSTLHSRAELRVSQSLAPCRAVGCAALCARDARDRVSLRTVTQDPQQTVPVAAVPRCATPQVGLRDGDPACAPRASSQQTQHPVPSERQGARSSAPPQPSCKRPASHASTPPDPAQDGGARAGKALRPMVSSPNTQALPRCHCLLIHLKRTGAPGRACPIS